MGSNSDSCTPLSGAEVGAGIAAGVDSALGTVDTMIGAAAVTGAGTVTVAAPGMEASMLGGTLLVMAADTDTGTAVSKVAAIDVDTDAVTGVGAEICTDVGTEIGAQTDIGAGNEAATEVGIEVATDVDNVDMDTGMEPGIDVGMEAGMEADIEAGTAADIETGMVPANEAGAVFAMVVAIRVGVDMTEAVTVTPEGGAGSGAIVTEEGSTTGMGVATDDTVSKGG